MPRYGNGRAGEATGCTAARERDQRALVELAALSSAERCRTDRISRSSTGERAVTCHGGGLGCVLKDSLPAW